MEPKIALQVMIEMGVEARAKGQSNSYYFICFKIQSPKLPLVEKVATMRQAWRCRCHANGFPKLTMKPSDTTVEEIQTADDHGAY